MERRGSWLLHLFYWKVHGYGRDKKRDRFYCLLPRVDGYWVRRQKIQLYSGIALGTCAYRYYDGRTGETEKFSTVAGHLHVMGLRIGEQRTAYFAEFGYGL
ncbi:hypothetical protein [Pontibacter chitinilyticus]|uniref:hypothetical protein n=1 Tax=Pontibacter chitinilyticus TaxID=2674989 RepID=UPI00321A8602